MNIDNMKEVQAKSNKMISEIHFKEQCSWLRNSKKKKDLKNKNASGNNSTDALQILLIFDFIFIIELVVN